MVAGRVPAGAGPAHGADGHQLPLLRDLPVRLHRRLPAETLPASRIRPLMMRKIAARMGLPNRTRNSCSNTSPTSPTGIVATMISQARRSSADRSCHLLVPAAGRMTWPIEEKNPRTIRTQSRQK
jgi:hypothetical protein